MAAEEAGEEAVTQGIAVRIMACSQTHGSWLSCGPGPGLGGAWDLGPDHLQKACRVSQRHT